MTQRFYDPPPQDWQSSDLRRYVKEIQQFLRDKDDTIHHLESDNKYLSKQLEGSQEAVIRYRSTLEGLGSRSSSGSSHIPDKEFQKLTQLDIRNNSRSYGVCTDLVIVFDPLEKSTRKLNSAYLPATTKKNYTKATLPPFHWWSDSISIYQCLDLTDPETGSPKIIVRKRQQCLEGESRVATVALGNLGWDIRLQRMFGRVKDLYVLSTDPPIPMEMRPLERE